MIDFNTKLELQFECERLEQIEKPWPYMTVHVFMGREDESLRNFNATLEIPVRLTDHRTMEELHRHCIDVARRMIDPEPIRQMLRYP